MVDFNRYPPQRQHDGIAFYALLFMLACFLLAALRASL